MTIAEIEHKHFLRVTNNKIFKDNVKSYQKTFSVLLLEALLNEHPEPQNSFVRELIKITKSDLYMISSGGTIQLFTKDFKSTIGFNIRKPNVNQASKLKVPWMIEIDTIHSKKRGYGKHLMNKVLAIADKINVPVCLWTETQKNINYFARYGFKSYGRCGKHNEALMIRKKAPIS